MTIPSEMQQAIDYFEYHCAETKNPNSVMWGMWTKLRGWIEATTQPAGEWVQVEGESTIKCGCDDDRCTAELHIDSLDGMAISIKDGDYTSTIYLPYDIRLCRKTEANSE